MLYSTQHITKKIWEGKLARLRSPLIVCCAADLKLKVLNFSSSFWSKNRRLLKVNTIKIQVIQYMFNCAYLCAVIFYFSSLLVEQFKTFTKYKISLCILWYFVLVDLPRIVDLKNLIINNYLTLIWWIVRTLY